MFLFLVYSYFKFYFVCVHAHICMHMCTCMRAPREPGKEGFQSSRAQVQAVGNCSLGDLEPNAGPL